MKRPRILMLLPALAAAAATSGCGGSADADGISRTALRHPAKAASDPSAGCRQSIASAIDAARHIYFYELNGPRARNDLRFIAGDRRLKEDLLRGEYGAATREARAQMFDNPIRHVTRVAVINSGKQVVNAIWNPDGVFVAKPREEQLRFRGHDLGTLRVSVQDVVGLVKLIKRDAGCDSLVRSAGNQERASRQALLGASLPASGNVTIGGRRYETASFKATVWGALALEAFTVWVLRPA